MAHAAKGKTTTVYAANPRPRSSARHEERAMTEPKKSGGKRRKKNPSMGAVLKTTGLGIAAGAAVTLATLAVAKVAPGKPWISAAGMAVGALVVGGGLVTAGQPEAGLVAAGLLGAGAVNQGIAAVSSGTAVASAPVTTNALVRRSNVQGIVRRTA
jgi:hypothetical protein